jgi:tetratricopeptide (TPR) repeat protein
MAFSRAWKAFFLWAVVQVRTGEAPKVEELISGLLAAPAEERGVWVHKLIEAGPDALDATLKARDSAKDVDLKKALSRAATWQVARKVTPLLREGFESQLTFAGQYVALRKEGPQVLEALLALVEDAASPGDIRLSACRALADVMDPRLEPEEAKGLGPIAQDPSLLPRLRKLYHDILLPYLLQEPVGLLLAILGDTQAVDSELSRLEKLARSSNVAESIQSHIQLSHLYYQIRSYEKAVTSYDKILPFYERVLESQRERRVSREVIAGIKKELALQYYNAACSSSLSGNLEKAKRFLRKAVELEATHFKNIEEDGDLANLRKAPGYAEFKKDLQESLPEK